MKSYLIFTNTEEDVKQQMDFAQMNGYEVDILDFINPHLSTVTWNPFQFMKEKINNESFEHKRFIRKLVDGLIDSNMDLALDISDFNLNVMADYLSKVIYQYLKCHSITPTILVDLQFMIHDSSYDFSLLSDSEQKLIKFKSLEYLERLNESNLLVNLINLCSEETYLPLPNIMISSLDQSPRVVLVVSDKESSISKLFSNLLLTYFYEELKKIRCLKSKKEIEVIFRILNLENYHQIDGLLQMIATVKPSEIKFEIELRDKERFKEIYKGDSSLILDYIYSNL